MNSPTGIRRYDRGGMAWVAYGVLFCFLIITGGCQSDSTNGAVEEPVPADGALTDMSVEGDPDTVADPDIEVENAPPVGEVRPDVAVVIDAVADSAGPLCLELTSARDRVLLGEPLTLLVTLRNCSSEKIEVRDLLGVEYGLMSILIGHPQSEQEQVYAPLVRRNGRGRGYVDLDAGEILTAVVPVYFGRDGWQVDTPGLYTFKAEYFVDEIAMTSNIVSVSIVAPQSDEDLAAAEKLMNADAATFLYLGGGEDKGAEQLRALVANSPDSPWADYANLGLAIELAADRSNSSTADTCRSLEASLDEVTSDWIIALRGYEALRSCFQDNGRESEVSRVTDRFLLQHPSAEAIVRARQE